MYDDTDLDGETVFDENGADLKAGFIQSKSGYGHNPTSQYGARLFPMNALMIKKVEQDPEDTNRLTFEGVEVSMVSLAGIVTGVNHQSTYTTILLNDGTDTIEVQKWNKKLNEGEVEFSSSTDIIVGTSVMVYGSLRSFNKTVNVSALEIRPAISLDEIIAKDDFTEQNSPEIKVEEGTDINKKVLDSLKLFSDFTQGVKRNRIYTLLKNYASEEQINNSINSLIRDGLAYVTINFDYVKAL